MSWWINKYKEISWWIKEISCWKKVQVNVLVDKGNILVDKKYK
jgi:hypothetical protein